MLILGLTGSIASGKSTASRILSTTHSLPIIDADVLARRVVEPGTTGFERIKDYFLPTTPDLLNADGSLNRAALGKRVFGDSEERRADRAVLNRIVHPAVRREMMKAIFWNWIKGHWAVVLDVPLLLEAGLDAVCGEVVLIDVSDEELQIGRILGRDKEIGGTMTREDARRRIQSQMPRKEKVGIMEEVWKKRNRGYIVENDSGKEELEKRLAEVVDTLQAKRSKTWTWLMLLIPFLTLGTSIWVLATTWWTKRTYYRKKAKSA
ncbi:putative dephospho-CoA kinase [Ascobolus immersus RN42]|uniref:Putative dephospho-CoA kinase n=1 Tax=Ascobolus immersus RN42 TaxID=1160509 RepID=A0A3N4I9I0_ASCIM|nr:putative dephospho-CoA kinase [Ascobolus immersus RN42]